MYEGAVCACVFEWFLIACELTHVSIYMHVCLKNVHVYTKCKCAYTVHNYTCQFGIYWIWILVLIMGLCIYRVVGSTSASSLMYVTSINMQQKYITI